MNSMSVSPLLRGLCSQLLLQEDFTAQRYPQANENKELPYRVWVGVPRNKCYVPDRSLPPVLSVRSCVQWSKRLFRVTKQIPDAGPSMRGRSVSRRLQSSRWLRSSTPQQ